MAKKIKNKGKFRKKMIHNYRLVVMSDDSMEERFSLKLNRLNILVFGSLFTLFLIVATSTLIAFTPLKNYIPGYSSSALKQKASTLVYKADSLEQKLAINEAYINNIKKILIGDLKFDEIKTITGIKHKGLEEINLRASTKDSLFRLEIEQKDRFSVFEKAIKKAELVFFAPVKGFVTDAYDLEKKHLAVDISLKKGTPIKSISDGTVIFSGFTVDTGYVILIEHAQGYLSVYKHNNTLFKKQGDFVKSGEVIANSGSTGTLTTGPHLHFELWSDGYAVDPEKYMDFE